MDSAADDIVLVQAARHGDKGAFGSLLVRHWSLVLSLCRRMLGSDDLAQDAAQEAAMQAWLSLDRLRCPEQFGPWLSGIALNISRHWLRNHGQGDCSWDALVGGRFDPRYVLADEQLGPDERAEASELRARVRVAVAALPRGQRAAIVLYYLYGLTQAETAAHLGIELGAVKTRLHKARGTLRKQLLALWEEQMTTPVPSPMVVMRIASVRKLAENLDLPPHVTSSHPHLQRIIFLEEIDGPRYLLIHVGEHEGYQLTATLNQTEMPRPMTYAFLANVLQAAPVTLREVQINRLEHNVFYATVLIEGSAGPRSVDARPIDALHLAALTGAPIRVAQDVLDLAGTTIERQTVHDDQGQEVIELTQRRATTGEMLARGHLDPTTFAVIREGDAAGWTASFYGEGPGEMDRFDGHARRVLELAKEEAQAFNHTWIGTEHLLLGLIREEGIAAQALRRLGIELDEVRGAIRYIIGRQDHPAQGEIGYAPRARKVLALAVDEAQTLGHDHVGSEHLLLGIVREGEGVAAGILSAYGVLGKVREQTLLFLRQAEASDAAEHHE